MRAAGPTEGNRKHHPKVAPPESYTAIWRFGFSQPQKMVFDCVYGRRRAVATNGSRYRSRSGNTSLYHTFWEVPFCDRRCCPSGTQPASYKGTDPSLCQPVSSGTAVRRKLSNFCTRSAEIARASWRPRAYDCRRVRLTRCCQPTSVLLTAFFSRGGLRPDCDPRNSLLILPSQLRSDRS